MKFSGNEVIEIKKRAAEFFRSRPEILFGFFFGSIAKGQGTPLSDLDFAVYVDKANLQAKKSELIPELISELMGVLKTNDIDVVLLNEAPPLLRHRILTQGERLMGRNPLQEQRFFVKSLQDYFDTAPLRSIQAHYLRQHLQGSSGRKRSEHHG